MNAESIADRNDDQDALDDAQASRDALDVCNHIGPVFADASQPRCTMTFGHEDDHGNGVHAWLNLHRLSKGRTPKLTPLQLDIADRLMNGETVTMGRQSGKTAIRDYITEATEAVVVPAGFTFSPAAVDEIERQVMVHTVKLYDAVTAPPCGARSVLGFSCDVPNTSPHEYHVSTDPAYPAQPHKWRTSADAELVEPSHRTVSEAAADALASVNEAVELAHELKRISTDDTLDSLLPAIDHLQSAWAALTSAQRWLKHPML